MRRISIIGLGALALGVTSLTACNPMDALGLSSPEDRIAGHLEDMTEIMEDHEDEPADGVEKLHEYIQDNLPSMMEAYGEIMVDLDKMDDPEDRAERIEDIAETLEDPVKDLLKAGEKFGEEAADDDDVMKYAEKWAEGWEETMEEAEDLEDLMDIMDGMGRML